MTFGLSLPAFTVLHVYISLIAMVAGIVLVMGMLAGRNSTFWTATFLVTTTLTSLTGFLFPFSELLPSHIVGAISLVVLAVAALAIYVGGLSGHWRWIYVAAALAAFYLNVFVGVVQAFQKIAFLQPLAPTQSEAPFLVAQLAALGIFLLLGYLALRSFHPTMPAHA